MDKGITTDEELRESSSFDYRLKKKEEKIQQQDKKIIELLFTQNKLLKELNNRLEYENRILKLEKENTELKAQIANISS